MASVSASTLIIFIASILVAASVAGTMTTGVSQLSDALDDRSVDVAGEVRTDVDIISDPGSDSVYDSNNNELYLLIKNSGSNTLPMDPDTIDIIVDGTYYSDVQLQLMGNNDSWREGAVVEVQVNNIDIGSGSHRAVVIVNGDRETFEFSN